MVISLYVRLFSHFRLFPHTLLVEPYALLFARKLVRDHCARSGVYATSSSEVLRPFSYPPLA